MGQPLVTPTLALITGIICSSRFRVPDEALLAALLFALALFLLPSRCSARSISLGLIAVSFLLLGWLEMNIFLYRPPVPGHIVNMLPEEAVSIEGIICEPPQIFPDKTDLVISLRRLTDGRGRESMPEGKVLLSFRGEKRFSYGDVVVVRSRLRRVRNFQNPGGFDYERYLRFQGILVRGFAADDSRIYVLRKGMGNPFRQRLETIRDRIRSFIDARAPSPEKEIIKACILGDQQEIPREVRDAFSKTGTSHIIAISGFNMGLVALFVLLLTRFAMRRFPRLLLRWDMQRVSLVAAIPPVILYTFIAGAGMSVLRATLMILSFMIALLLVRSRDHFNALAMAAMIILLAHPPALFDISFQLSFAAVASILFVSPRLLPRMVRKSYVDENEANRLALLLRKCKVNLWIFLVVSLSATAATMPLIALYFNRVALVSFPANMVLVPILGILAVPVSLVTIIFMPISNYLSSLALDLAGTLVMTSLALNDFFAALPWASLYVNTPNIVELICYYMLIICLLLLSPAHHDGISPKPAFIVPHLLLGYLIAALLAAICIDVLLVTHRLRENDTLAATAIDVGQGSATLVRFPGDKVMLIDGGGFPGSNFDVGRYVVAPFIWKQRIAKIDFVVLTHPHPDHLNGLPFILENFDIGEVWTNGDRADSPEFAHFQRLVKAKGIPHRRCSAATPPWHIAGVRLEFLNPPFVLSVGNNSTGYREANDRSLVLRMTYGGISYLFCGDISGDTEARIVDSGVHLESQLLFVPHHGGHTSATEVLLRAVRPEVAIISAGYNNYFRLPHYETLKRLGDSGIRIYRTDFHGAITAQSDGSAFTVTPFHNP